ncbi:ATPase, T2SS/T4P/T4SS family [Alteromonas sp. 14N.309.X.WAT.G.H12]|uniref:ATPase, T2SS/T4P/T4SS family n=1 Tax=Alteromonas sp. 14N.309.X.WAT.G.H12 TaxID=3120824 RepID=UPI002FCF2303
MGFSPDIQDPTSLFLPDSIEEEIVNGMSPQTINKIFSYGRLLKVSDVIFQVGFPIWIKINNFVFPISKSEISLTVMQQIIEALFKAPEGDDRAFMEVMSGKNPDISYTFKISKSGQRDKFIRYRVNITRDGESGLSAFCRLNNEVIPKLEDIGQSPGGEIYQSMFRMKGTVLVTGAVDSGKTTLVYSCLNHFILYDERPAVINTYENPIEGDLQTPAKEYSEVGNKVVCQCPVPQGAADFKDGVKRSLRRNADIILLGEIRTPDEADSFVEGANATAKLMIATLHTDSIPLTIDRMLNLLRKDSQGETQAMLNAYLNTANMIVSQKLINTIDKKRVAAYECLVFTQEVREKLKSVSIDEITETVAQIMKSNGNTMVDKARKYYEQGIISEKTFREFERDFGY